MLSIMSALLSSTASSFIFPLIDNVAGAYYPKVIADAENFVSHIEGTSPLVADAAKLIAGVLMNSPTVAGTMGGTISDVETVLSTLIGGALGKLSASDPSVTGTTVATSGSAPLASTSVGVSAPSVAQDVGSVVSAVLDSHSTGILSAIEGLFTKHSATVASAAGTAAAEAVAAKPLSPVAAVEVSAAT